ncbi:MAG TPA: hypothetical protein VGO40_16800 [Longimicrobium sp.]|jgi:hypothetical protein|nr:hypothetical protein [Longimicrobium sp.]
MHLDPEQVQRLLHGELEPGDAVPLRAHAAGCTVCGGRLDAAAREEEELFRRLGLLDHPVPRLTAGELARRAAPTRSPVWRMAAGIVLAFAASGVLYAFPGSPLPALVRGGGVAHPPAAPRPAPPAPPEPGRPSGVAVVPGGDFAIVFASPQARGSARVRVVDGPELAVRAFGAPVRFDLGVDRVTIANAGAAADYEVLLPRGARSVRIQVGGATVLRKTGGRIATPSSPDAHGIYVIPLQR